MDSTSPILTKSGRIWCRDCSSVSDNRGAVRVEVAVQEYRNTQRKLPRVHLISRLETMMKMNKA